jgi:hypothetical protein
MSDMPLSPGLVKRTSISLASWSDKNRTFAEYLTKCDGWEGYTVCHWVGARKINILGRPIVVIWSLYNLDNKLVAYIMEDHPKVVFVLDDDKAQGIVIGKYLEQEKQGAVLIHQSQI